MPLIPSQPQTERKETLSLRLEREVHDRLKLYAEFIDSSKDYVIGQALVRLFRKDKEFAAWTERRSAGAELAPVPASSPALPAGEAGAPAPRSRVTKGL